MGSSSPIRCVQRHCPTMEQVVDACCSSSWQGKVPSDMMNCHLDDGVRFLFFHVWLTRKLVLSKVIMCFPRFQGKARIPFRVTSEERVFGTTQCVPPPVRRCEKSLQRPDICQRFGRMR